MYNNTCREPKKQHQMEEGGAKLLQACQGDRDNCCRKMQKGNDEVRERQIQTFLTGLRFLLTCTLSHTSRNQRTRHIKHQSRYKHVKISCQHRASLCLRCHHPHMVYALYWYTTYSSCVCFYL